MSLVRVNYTDMRVLVAVSNPQLADYVRHFLRDTGAESVQLVHDSMDAINRCRDFSFTHFFVGYTLDGLGGCELSRFIRMTDGEMSEAPILMVMSNPDREKIMRARDSGINEIVAVPFTAKTLEERLQRAVQSKRAFVRTNTYIGPCRRSYNSLAYKGVDRHKSASSRVEAIRAGA